MKIQKKELRIRVEIEIEIEIEIPNKKKYIDQKGGGAW